jgi:hypothetical protein
MPGFRPGISILAEKQLEMVLIIVVMIVHHVVHGATITFAEPLAEITASAFVDGRMFIHFMAIGIHMAMFTEIVSSGFNTLVEATLLSIAVSGRGLIPTILIMFLCSNGNGLCLMGAGLKCAS